MTPPRPVAFILANTDHGTLIVNRFDYHTSKDGRTFGVGHETLERGNYSPDEIKLLKGLLNVRRDIYGSEVIAIDGGANIGIMTVEMARHMAGWGRVVAFEPQEPIYYALCGNLVLNNCKNVKAFRQVLGGSAGCPAIPVPDYSRSASFGSLEMRIAAGRERREDIGQDGFAGEFLIQVPIDSIALPRLDLLKLDVEGMELEALHGAQETIQRLRPILWVETIKTGVEPIKAFATELGYETFAAGMNMLAVHKEDESIHRLEKLLP